MPSESAGGTVVLIGNGPTSLTAIESLAEQLTVAALVRDPDSRGDDSDPVCKRALELGVPVSHDTTMRGIEQLIERIHPDCVVVSSYNRILPARLIAKTRFVNVHYSLLPRYRGRANVNWSIINGEKETGISIHVLSPGLDSGAILFQQAVAIGPSDTVTDLYQRLNALQRKALGAAVQRHIVGDNGRPQDEGSASHACTRLPRDGEIDWAQPTLSIYNLIRALTDPYPGAFTYFEGAPLTIWRAEPVSDPIRYDGRVPGRVVKVSKADGWIDVLTGDGLLKIHDVQPSGGTLKPAAEVITSLKDTLGLQTLDLLKRIQMLESALAELRGQRESLLASGTR